MKKLFLKNLFFFLSLACSLPSLARQEEAVPTLSDVFSGLSEAEIAEQVKQGQAFLEELEKNGSPEDKAAFEQLLMETLNSMSEQDFQDIQNIAKMVEPHLDIPKEDEGLTKSLKAEEKKEIEKKIESSTDSKNAMHWFKLTPKKKDNSFAFVKMGFGQDKQLKEMQLQDQIGHSTHVQFSKIELNVSLPAKLFVFKAPAGTDVIDETRQAN